MTTHQWYVTAQWYTWQNEQGHLHRTPTGPAHAKTFGTGLTACGIPCDSWTKFWHLPYLECKNLETCLDCDLTIAQGPRESQPTLAPDGMVRKAGKRARA